MFVIVPLWAHVPIRQQPWVNFALMGLTILVSWWCIAWPEDALYLAGFEERRVPGMTWREMDEMRAMGYPVGVQRVLPAPVSALTSTLVHGGSMHLIGNMLFLWVFGNAVNLKLGHARFGVLYFLSALLSGSLHAAMEWAPVIGASGAIYGIVGAFLVCFPLERITMFVWIPLIYRPKMTAVAGVWIIPFWVMWDLLMVMLGDVGVAHWSHLGGFVTGFLVAFLFLVTGWVQPKPGDRTLLHVLGIPSPRRARRG